MTSLNGMEKNDAFLAHMCSAFWNQKDQEQYHTEYATSEFETFEIGNVKYYQTFTSGIVFVCFLLLVNS